MTNHPNPVDPVAFEHDAISAAVRAARRRADGHRYAHAVFYPATGTWQIMPDRPLLRVDGMKVLEVDADGTVVRV